MWVSPGTLSRVIRRISLSIGASPKKTKARTIPLYAALAEKGPRQ
jgi:hypothetical protein